MKSGVMSALSSNTIAQTLPEWEGKCVILSLDRSGWTTLAMDHRTSEIFPPVRYCFMPCLFTNTPMGSESDWPNLLAQRKILYAALTGQIFG
jgi:hypothetical protein